VPGMKFQVEPLGTAVYVGTVWPHPLYPNLVMVIWWMDWVPGWSHDALSPLMEHRDVVVNGPADYEGELRRVLHRGGRA
jgi:hypothetical protein